MSEKIDALWDEFHEIVPEAELIMVKTITSKKDARMFNLFYFINGGSLYKCMLGLDQMDVFSFIRNSKYA